MSGENDHRWGCGWLLLIGVTLAIFLGQLGASTVGVGK